MVVGLDGWLEWSMPVAVLKVRRWYVCKSARYQRDGPTQTERTRTRTRITTYGTGTGAGSVGVGALAAGELNCNQNKNRIYNNNDIVATGGPSGPSMLCRRRGRG